MIPRSVTRIALALAVAAFLPAQHGSTTKTNPFDSAADRAEGARLFKAQCAACHGPNGSGGSAGPDLTGALKRNDADESLFQIVAKGLPGTTMPPYPGSGKEVWQIVAYVKSFGVGKAAAKGNAVRGAELFGKSGCANCHSAGSFGAVVGPDLSVIGSYRTLGHLLRSVTNPNDEVLPDYWTVRGRTKNGEKISGIRLNEDTYSIQYRTGGVLKSVMKKDLAEHELVATSPMPSYKGKLSDKDIEDVIAYLASLREVSK